MVRGLVAKKVRRLVSYMRTVKVLKGLLGKLWDKKSYSVRILHDLGANALLFCLSRNRNLPSRRVAAILPRRNPGVGLFTVSSLTQVNARVKHVNNG